MRRLIPAVIAVAVMLVACDPADERSSSDRSTSTTIRAAIRSTTSTSTSIARTTAPAATTSIATKTTTTEPRVGRPLEGLKVVVDPGHNGANGKHSKETNRLVDAGGFRKPCNTTGTADSGYTESRFNWETAQRVRDALEAAGAVVTMTRSDDNGWGPCVDQRGLTSERAGADVLVSIHADGSAARNSGFHVISPASIPGFTDQTASRSKSLATVLRDAMVAQGFSPSNYIGRSGLDVRRDLGTLNRSPVPSVMIECGNMHHRADLDVLRSPSGQSRIARAIVDALAADVSDLKP